MLYILKWFLEIGSHKQITREKLACRTYLASRVPKGLRVRAWVCVKVRYIYIIRTEGESFKTKC